MRVYVAADHAGFELKERVVQHLTDQEYDAIDCGAADFDAEDDYPALCIRAAQQVAGDPDSLGIVIGGSGNGEQIAANKVPGIRAALAWNSQVAELARAHNNANVVGIGARMHPEAEALAIIDAFVTTPFSGADRHTRRINQLARYEKTGEITD